MNSQEKEISSMFPGYIPSEVSLWTFTYLEEGLAISGMGRSWVLNKYPYSDDLECDWNFKEHTTWAPSDFLGTLRILRNALGNYAGDPTLQEMFDCFGAMCIDRSRGLGSSDSYREFYRLRTELEKAHL